MCKQQINPEKFYKPHDIEVPIPPPDFKIFCNKGDRLYTDVPHVNYLYPVDYDEVDRLQFQSDICRRIWKSLFSAPVDRLLEEGGAKVLDVGCGPGMWTLDAAANYPLTKFTGVDIAPIYPISIKPTNAEFLQANVAKGLPYNDNTFDYVICRLMNCSYTKDDWEVVITEMSRVCKIGGYVEFMEKDVEFEKEGAYTRKERERFIKILRKKNFEPIISPEIKNYIEETGNFSAVQHEKRAAPLGEWGSEIGKANKIIFKWSAENLKTVMVGWGYYEAKEWDEIVDKCIEELNEKCCFDYFHRIWAQKKCHQQEQENESKIVDCKCSSSSRWLNLKNFAKKIFV